jgi:hypothetical protein
LSFELPSQQHLQELLHFDLHKQNYLQSSSPLLKRLVLVINNFFSFFTRIESVLNARAHSNTEQLKIVADLKNQTSEGGALEGSATQANKGLGD